MQLPSQSHKSLHAGNIQALSKLRSDQGQLFSLYLDLRPENRDAENLTERFNHLLSQTEQQKKTDQYPRAYREQWDKEVDRIHRWLETAKSLQGQGLVVFSSFTAQLWQVFLLPVPMVDRLIVDRQLFLRPLEILLGENNCTLVVLMDASSTRFVEVFLGRAEEVAHTQAMPVTGETLGDTMRQHIQSAVEHAEAVWQEHTCGHLVIGGSGEMLSELRDQLPDQLREHLAGEVRLSPQAEIEEIQDQVLEIEGDLERRLEAQRVEELVTSSEKRGGGAVLGLEQTLLAVRAGKVRLLITEEDFHQEGGECPNCGYLSDEKEETVCLLCGMALRPEPDIIEVALKRVLNKGGEIEILRSQGSRRALEPYGRIGVLLYDAKTPPTEKDSANRMPLSRDGEKNNDAVHDEAIEESFPASDPPGRSH